MSADFWVIFDTCSRAVYYRDVHNILALPSGATITYNYRSELLSDDARRLADSWKRGATPEAGPNVLFMYGQTKGFRHGDEFETAINSADAHPVWIPTRLGRMLDIKVQNERCYFKIQLSEYPRVDLPTIVDLVRSLGSDHPLTPKPDKGRWVSISHRHELLTALAAQRGQSAEQWHSIVTSFQRDTQFHADSFWRLSNPTTVRGKHLIVPGESEADEFNAGLMYRVEHEKEFYFDLENHEPRDSDGRNVKPRFIVAVADSQSLKVSPAETELRPYGVRTIRVRPRSEELFKDSDYTLKLSTGGQQDEWPVGPAFTCKFLVRKNAGQLIAGITCGLVGAGGVYWATHFVGESSSLDCKKIGLGIFIAGIAFLSASSYMLYRQLKFSVGSD
jgi:hypothetical protein